MSIRSRMKMRADVYRDDNLGTDDAWNGAAAPDYQLYTAQQPCYLYQPKMGGEMQGERNVNIYTWQMLTPLTIIITEQDQVRNVTDRLGTEVTSHTFNVVQIVRKPQHYILTLEAVTSGAT